MPFPISQINPLFRIPVLVVGTTFHAIAQARTLSTSPDPPSLSLSPHTFSNQVLILQFKLLSNLPHSLYRHFNNHSHFFHSSHFLSSTAWLFTIVPRSNLLFSLQPEWPFKMLSWSFHSCSKSFNGSPLFHSPNSWFIYRMYIILHTFLSSRAIMTTQYDPARHYRHSFLPAATHYFY